MTFDADTAFLAANAIALWGWIALLASPWFPVWSDRIAGVAIPLLLAVAYVIMAVLFLARAEGGYFTLDGVIQLFSTREVVLTGWLHVLAFDLFIGAWITRTARAEAIAFAWVVPCLILAFAIGPAGLLAFFGVRAFASRKTDRPGTI